jgi:hypothetical protein
MATLWAYGDSWAWGWAGMKHFGSSVRNPPFRNCYVNVVARKLGAQVTNRAYPGDSFGHQLSIFYDDSIQIQPGDYVFFTLPPDSRWYTTDYGNREIRPIMFYDSHGNPTQRSREFFTFIDNNLYWFVYHINMFITGITTWCKANNVYCIIQHNYGKLDLLPWCDTSAIMDVEHSMWNWLGIPEVETLHKVQNGPNAEDPVKHLQPKMGDGTLTDDEREYFEQTQLQMKKVLITDPRDPGANPDLHPNEESHKLIGKKIYELFQKRMG